MSDFGIVQQYLTTIEMDGKPCTVSVRIAYDGIEYIGRLFFADPETGEGIPDHGAIPGRTVDEAVEFARRLTADDFTTARARAHHLMNSAAVVRDDWLYAACASVERAAIAGDKAALAAGWQTCEAALEPWTRHTEPKNFSSVS